MGLSRLFDPLARFRVIEYLANEKKPGDLKYFTERKLRPLTLMKSDSRKIAVFNEMIEESKNIEISNNKN